MRFLDWFRVKPKQAPDLEDVIIQVQRLRGDMKQLELQWEETYGKVRRALATLARRQQRENAGGEEEVRENHAPSESPYQEAVRRGLFGG